MVNINGQLVNDGFLKQFECEHSFVIKIKLIKYLGYEVSKKARIFHAIDEISGNEITVRLSKTFQRVSELDHRIMSARFVSFGVDVYCENKNLDYAPHFNNIRRLPKKALDALAETNPELFV